MNANDWANVELFLLVVGVILAVLGILELIERHEERAERRLFEIRRGVERANMHEGIRRTYGLHEYVLAVQLAGERRPSRLERRAYRRTALGHATHRHPAYRTAYPISRTDARIGGDERD